LADLMRAHLAAGGLIVAASHGPIGIAPSAELRLGVAP
jgi:heme exporter protein A